MAESGDKKQASFDAFSLIGENRPEEPLDLTGLVSIEQMEADCAREEARGNPWAAMLRRLLERRKKATTSQ